MAYHGYIPAVKDYLSNFKTPRVLEVGLDRGVSTIPLVCHMSKRHESFLFVGVDVLVQESLKITLHNLEYGDKHIIRICEGNSLDVMPQLVQQGTKFDVILLDGDHNYYTVAKELSYLDQLTHENTLVIIDDYEGRWSDKDLWYSDRKEYENVKLATKPQDTEKHGVKAAVDEFLESSGLWKMSAPIKGEPVVLTRKDDV